MRDHWIQEIVTEKQSLELENVNNIIFGIGDEIP